MPELNLIVAVIHRPVSTLTWTLLIVMLIQLALALWALTGAPTRGLGMTPAMRRVLAAMAVLAAVGMLLVLLRVTGVHV